MRLRHFDPLSFPAESESVTYNAHMHGDSAEGPAFAIAVQDGDGGGQRLPLSTERGDDVHVDGGMCGAANGVGQDQRSARLYGRGCAIRAHPVRVDGAFRPTLAVAGWTSAEAGESANLQVRFGGPTHPGTPLSLWQSPPWCR